MKLIVEASEGLTRRINILADKSLLAAFADGTHQVTAKHARAAVRDSEFGARPAASRTPGGSSAPAWPRGSSSASACTFANQLRLSHGAAPVADPMTAAPAPAPQAGGIANQDRPVQVALPSSERPELSQTARPNRRAGISCAAPAATPILQSPLEVAASQPPVVLLAGPGRPCPGNSRKNGLRRRRSG